MYTIYTDRDDDYLAHFRIKGSRNGDRRFQTESGEWTEEGLARRREQYAQQKQALESKANEITRTALKSKSGFSFLGRLKDEKINEEKVAKAKEEVKNLSDEELQKINKRMNLEKNYVDLKAPASHKNEQLVRDICDATAAIGGAAATAIGIVFAVKKYKLAVNAAKIATNVGLGKDWDA